MTKKVSDLDVEFAFQNSGAWVGAGGAFFVGHFLTVVGRALDCAALAPLACLAFGFLSMWQSRRQYRKYLALRRIRSEQAMKDLDEAHEAQRKDLAQMQAKLAERFFGGLN